jgi:O-Antigen ligase
MQSINHRMEADSFRAGLFNPSSPVLFWLVAVLMGTSTWWRAGNRSLPLIWLEWLALGVLVSLLWQWQGAHRRRWEGRFRPFALAVVLLAPLWMGLLQLVPWFGTRPASLAPDATMLSVMAGLPVVASMAAALWLTESQTLRLLALCAFMGVLQSLLGLLQLAFPALLFEPLFPMPVLGSFGNKNSLGNFLAMMLPLLWLWAIGSSDRGKRERPAWQGWGARAGLLLLLAGLVASLSRAGLITGVVVLALAVSMFPFAATRANTSGWHRLLRWWPLVLVMLGLSLGSWEWLARFESDRLATDDAVRGLMREQTWNAAQAFWPLGSGMGTFTTVFPAYQPPEIGKWFVNFAHNDYLQLLMEAGALVLPPALALLWLVGRRVLQLVQARRRGPWPQGDAVALACGLGFLAQALHAWVDYPWRIPATAMLGAFMLGVFLREPEEAPHKRRRTGGAT